MAKHTIKIKKYADVVEELEAAGTITPGMLIEVTSAGKVQAHSTSGGNALKVFALEDELQGNGIDVDYDSGDQVQCWIPGRGDQVYAFLADGESVAIGDFLESNGDGKLKKHTAPIDSASDVTTIYAECIVGQATEAVDMSGSSGVDPTGRIIVRII